MLADHATDQCGGVVAIHLLRSRVHAMVCRIAVRRVCMSYDARFPVSSPALESGSIAEFRAVHNSGAPPHIRLICQASSMCMVQCDVFPPCMPSRHSHVVPCTVAGFKLITLGWRWSIDTMLPDALLALSRLRRGFSC